MHSTGLIPLPSMSPLAYFDCGSHIRRNNGPMYLTPGPGPPALPRAASSTPLSDTWPCTQIHTPNSLGNGKPQLVSNTSFLGDVGDYVHGCSRTPHRAYPRPTGVVNIRVGSSFVFRVARQVVFCFWYNFFHIDNHRFREANSRSSSEY